MYNHLDEGKHIMVRISPEILDTTDLPRIPLDETTFGWKQKGACLEVDPELFFHTEGERGLARRTRAEKAKLVCGSCSVIQICRVEALKNDEQFGTWGGLSEDDRDKLRKAQARNRRSSRE